MPLFKKILVPHDASEAASQALLVAADLARRNDGRLIVLRAIAPFVPFSDLGSAEGSGWVPPEDVVSLELASLERLVKKVLTRNAPPVECRVEVGSPYETIMDASADVDSIIMATHGRTGLEHLLIGSVAEKVVRHATVPVLTIRPHDLDAKKRR
ncbi:universal stress protein [Candidatus Binatia bacterium]|nr:universal stress protein [Candidatus Binatia bacterium]